MVQATALYRVYELPWTANAGEDHRFKRILGTTAGALAVLALLVAVLPVPERDPASVEEVPKRLARLVLERQAPPPPPPVPRVVEELPPAPEPEPVVEERSVPPPEPEPVVERRQPPPEPAAAPVPEPAPAVDTVQAARERARTAGLLPFAEQLASLRDSDTASRLDRAATAEVGAGTGAAPVVERSLITSRVGSGSGGIDTAALSRDTGGSGLAARATTQVASPVADVAAAQAAGGAGSAAGGGAASSKAARSREEIERVFDRNKGAIYALYNRALRENPSLQGKLVLTLTIAPDGRVTHCEIVSSELGDPALEQKLVQRVLLFQFDARDVEAVTTTKPIDFFPA